jgi:hypothetical protein
MLGPGIEPGSTDSESIVIPLHYTSFVLGTERCGSVEIKKQRRERISHGRVGCTAGTPLPALDEFEAVIIVMLSLPWFWNV